MYCSHQCACDVQNEAARQEALRRRPTAACKVCGETFKQKTRQHKYCSPKCKRRATYVRYDRFRHCERIKARTDLSDAEKERRIARIIGPVPEPSEEEIEARAAAERAKWNGAELKRRIVGPAPQ